MLMHLKAKAKEKNDSHDIDKKLVVPIKMLSALDHVGRNGCLYQLIILVCIEWWLWKKLDVLIKVLAWLNEVERNGRSLSAYNIGWSRKLEW